MAGRTYLKVAFSISIFFVATGWAGAAAETIYINAADGPYPSNPFPADGAVIPGSPMGDDIYTTLEFTAGADANSHEAFFSDDPARVYARDPNVSLGPPPYPTYPTRYYVGVPSIGPYTKSLVRGTTYYWCVDETDANGLVWQGSVWSFSILTEKAWDPDPTDGKRFVSITPILSWKAGSDAQWHVIYFGTNFDDVNDSKIEPLVPPPLSYRGWKPVGDEDWDPNEDGGLTIEFETTYYWRIDEGKEGLPPPIGGGTVIKGDVWSFTTVPEGLGTIKMDLWWNMSCPPPCKLDYVVSQYPPNETRMLTSFNSGTNFADDYVGMIYGWLHPAKSGDYTFWLCTDDNSELYLSSDERPSNMQLIAKESTWADPYTWNNDENMSAPISLVAGRKYYIMALWTDGTGGDHCMVAWQGPDQPLDPVDGEDFAIIPGSRLSPFMQYWASDPDPCDGQGSVGLPVNLRWEPGDNAASHNVYFGTEFNAVKNAYYDPRYPPPPAVFLATTTEPNILVSGLASNTKYYWRIDEFPPPVPPLPYPSGPYYRGDVWSFTTEPRRIYVDMDAAGANNGASWENAYNYLQNALTDAGSLEKPVEICVAQGIYKPDQGVGQTPGDREATFQLNNGVAIKGGYAGFGEPDPDTRDIKLYETILSGDLADNDTEVDDLEYLLIDPCRTDNSFRVVTGDYTDETAALDGFIISAANNDRAGFPISVGGGIFIYEGSPTITNCILRTNAASDWGGGMYVIYSQSYIDNCTFIGNYSVAGGGLCTGACNSTISNCIFIGNQAVRGAGVRNISGDIKLINCLFVGNSASSGGGLATRSSNPTLTYCTFSENLNGGGVHNLSGNPTLTNCILWGDNSMEIYGDAPTVTYSDVQGGWPGLGNIDADPCFADPCNGDYHLKSQAGRWDSNSQSWIKDDVTSPCIDAGNPGCPVGDEPAPNGNRRNMGAYGGTAEASKSPPNWRSIADMTNDWVVDSNDLKVFADYWLESGECIPSDFDRSQFVDFDDFAIFGLHWSYPFASGPGMTFHIGDCTMEAGPNWTVTAEPNQPRFSVWVEGRYIYFEDQMYANCCPDELGLDKEINGNEITLYEIGYGGLCDCMCYFLITATLGPFEDGTYTVEVYDNYGNSLGIVEVTIGGSPKPTVIYKIEDCNPDASASGVFAAEPPDLTRFTVTVEGLYIHFEDMMTANCCPDELGLEMVVEDNLITIYETEYTPGGCWCICDYPVTATLGPFEPGIYTLDVYEEWSGFIGSTTVVIELPQ